MTKTIALVAIMLSTVCLSGCSAPSSKHSLPHVPGALSEETFFDQYAGLYILSREIRDQIKDNEAKRLEHFLQVEAQRPLLTTEAWAQLKAKENPDTLYPRTLPFGCTYHWHDDIERSTFHGYTLDDDAPEAKLIKAHIGKANWQKYKSGIKVTSFLTCLHRKYGLTIMISVPVLAAPIAVNAVKDAPGMGFNPRKKDTSDLRGFKVFELVDDEFVRRQ